MKTIQCLSTDKWINKMWHIYTMEYYSVVAYGKLFVASLGWQDTSTLAGGTVASPVSPRTEHMSQCDALYIHSQEFFGGPVVRTLRFHCRGPRFNPWSGN